MTTDIHSIVKEFSLEMKRIFGKALNSVIIYGSYARGDYTDLSDIDIMILVSLKDDEIKKITDSVSDCAFDFMMKYGVDISPMVKNIEHFNYWSDNLPFYRNVKEEGVKFIA